MDKFGVFLARLFVVFNWICMLIWLIGGLVALGFWIFEPPRIWVYLLTGFGIWIVGDVIIWGFFLAVQWILKPLYADLLKEAEEKIKTLIEKHDAK